MMNDVREYKLPASFFAGNREKLMARLPERVLAVAFAGRAVPMSADQEYPFFANRNFYYLTGIEQEESALVVVRTGEEIRTILFIQTADAIRERWTGRRLRRDEASELSGIDDVRFLPLMEDFLKPYMSDHSYPVALAEGAAFGPAKDFEKQILSLSKEREVISLEKILTAMRMFKEPSEVEMIRKAIELTDEAIREAAARIVTDVTELDLTTAFDYALARRGCLLPAFTSIFAAGENALCLHHMKPSGKAGRGDLIQIDVGGRVAGLCADISRVFPASGSFSPEQKALYAAVRACQETAFRYIRPGGTLAGMNAECRITARAELEKMGVMNAGNPAEDDVGLYYWHSASHHMGHDVHDVCIREMPFEPGMVLTVEPGIYIPERGIGFRIEDDVLVTENGCEILSESVPREWDEMCAMTGKKGGE